MEKKQIIQSVCMYMAAVGMVVGSAASVNATQIYDQSWTTITDEDSVTDNGFVGPGVGGQPFDAEYLAYKWDAATEMLSIGLQSGFDLSDGKQWYNTKKYFAGDLALSFDGDSTYYEYAVDFGFKRTRDYLGGIVGGKPDAPGVYMVTQWSDGNFPTAHNGSSPFAMKTGLKKVELDENVFSHNKGTDNPLSYFRYVSFNVGNLGLGLNDYSFDAHWTMSCGNDAIQGHGTAHAPEPTTMLLFGTGLIGLAGVSRRRSSKKQ